MNTFDFDHFDYAQFHFDQLDLEGIYTFISQILSFLFIIDHFVHDQFEFDHFESDYFDFDHF